MYKKADAYENVLISLVFLFSLSHVFVVFFFLLVSLFFLSFILAGFFLLPVLFLFFVPLFINKYYHRCGYFILHQSSSEVFLAQAISGVRQST